MDSITNIEIKDRHISWMNQGDGFDLNFQYKIFQAAYISNRQQFLVIADPRECGPNNLFIYDACGKLIANPPMPILNTKVEGVYSMWYVEGNDQQIVVFLTPHITSYETKCKFSLIDYTFTEVSLTR